MSGYQQLMQITWKVISVLMILLNSKQLMAYEPQCIFLSDQQVTKAIQILEKWNSKNEIPVIDSFCEFCTDKYPKPIILESANISKDIDLRLPANLKNESISKIEVNGTVVDLAYLYVDGKNLAFEVGCETYGVSKELD